ncbi:hypothetical protein MNBD_DELTA01-297 [hydrothermal vent metagenome]|uniref:Uncharacterized protein n=1 Tax=hydrothermal vent metagenome TaxID=652676 RepID=A0A3B0QTW4_9ZZZZ
MKCEKCDCDLSDISPDISFDRPALCSVCSEKTPDAGHKNECSLSIPFKSIILKNLITSVITGLIITSGVNIYGFVFKDQQGFAQAGPYLRDTFLLQSPKSGVFYLIWAVVMLVFFLRGVLRAFYKESLKGVQR